MIIRILAHKIVFEGREYPLSLLEISEDRSRISITPFAGETHSTVFVDGKVEVIWTDEGYTYRRI